MRFQTMVHTLVGLVALVAATPQPSTVHACQPPPEVVESKAPMTQQSEIAPDGGVVVVTESTPAPPRADIAALEIKADGVLVTPKVRELAEGLAVWSLPGAAKAARTMTWGIGQSRTITVGARGTALKAPRLKIVASTTPQPSRAEMANYRYGTPSTTLAIRLAKPLPDDAVALVVTLGSGQTARGVYWSGLESSKTDFTFNGGGKGCAGSSESVYIGEQVRISYVTANGRVSPVASARATRLTDKIAETFTQ